MDTQTVTLFLALLAVIAEVFVVGSLVLIVGSRFSPALARVRAAAVAQIGPQALGLAFVVALVSMAGSLYLSEVADFPPCKLCWFQRIAMYPQVFLGAMALVRRDQAIRPYLALLSIVGGTISIWHLFVERFPDLESGSCDPANPCSIIWVERFGYLTIPAMALSAFAAITVLVLAYPAAGRPVPAEELP